MFRVYIYKCKAPLFVKNSAPWKAFFRKRYPPYFRDRGNYEQCLIIVTRKGGRTGRSTHLCSEPSYTRNHSSLTWVYENVNKSNNRAAKTLFGPIYLPFLCNNHQFCFFFVSNYKHNRIKLCYKRFQCVKETQITTVSNTKRTAKLRRS